MKTSPPPLESIREDVERALREDVGGGDLTACLLAADARSEVRVVCRQWAVICGSAWFDEVFHRLDPGIRIDWAVADGDEAAPDQILCRLSGNSRALLTGERSALNFLQTLSGTATLAARYAKAVAGLGVRILDTRKTLPGLRLAQKYAVACGGCHNHRIGLFDAVLIKENHIAAAGSITAALERAFGEFGAGIEIEVEVENLDELREALTAGAKRILLDNFTLEGLREAVRLNGGKARLEASGGVSLETVRAIAETGVDDISVGGITKDLTAVDLSMRFLLDVVG
ncbi:MAG: nicotinate-nucleotide diphosphorylase (carboxylating) [Gammaproteobacteria bacterium RIFOXYA12_FULL_61_12]|nr:MAG: nicotinate-nucleotide diphosphorylase (carboxylating) [Gammaproteobacteria bacterium RIFOXYD12_FULL_61_37]OGT93223.1 MAG: nicotinate-nucleotide diphosphorylase (carboxylating) [Gammaproteobacteria bacterium RIFOXYA12_FULL_61_12]